MKLPSIGRMISTFSAAMLVVLFGGNVVLFLFQAGIWSVPPFVFVTALGVLAAALAFSRAERQALRPWPLVFWCLAYVVLNSAYFLFSSQSAPVLQEFTTRLWSAAFLIVAMLIFATPWGRGTGARAFALVLIASLMFNLVDIMQPNTFSIVVGRAAGLYLNPNIAAGVIVATMLLLIASIPARRMLWLLIGSLAVILTLSRGGLISWVVVVMVLLFKRTIPFTSALRWVAVLAVVVTLLGLAGYLDPILQTFTSTTAFASRIAAFSASPGYSGESGDVSIPMRLLAAKEAWNLFLAHPLLGAGIGATTEWSLSIYPHNIYLRHLAEHGILGFVIYLSFVAAITWRMPKGVRFAMAAFWLVLGLFDHNVLDNRALLTIAGFCASWPWLPGPSRTSSPPVPKNAT